MLEWLARKKNAVKMVLVYRSGCSMDMETRVRANTLNGALRELEWLWLSEIVIEVRIVRFCGELAGWYALEPK